MTRDPASLAWGWVVLLCVLLCGCGRDEVLSLSRLELLVPGRPMPTPISIPQHLDALLPAHDCEYQLRARVLLPESMHGRALTLAIPHLFAASTLTVDGVEMVELDPDPMPRYRSRGTPRFRIPASLSAHQTIDVALRVRHRWTQSGWLDTPIRISATVAGDSFSYFTETFNREGAWVGLVTALVAGLIALLTYLLDRRQVAFAWFSLEAVLGSSMPLFQMGAGTQLFGVYDTAMMAVGVTAALWASVRFTHAQFGLGAPHRLLDVLLIFTLLLIASGPDPFVLTHRAGPTVIAFISVNVVYQIVATARLWSHEVHKVQARVLAISWAAMGFAAGPDQLAWVGFGEAFGGVRAGPLGVGAVALLQVAVLSHDYVRTLKRTDVLNLELADRVRSLESKDLENSALNEVLRRQIAARSEQLAHALVRLGTAHPMPDGELEVGSVLENRYRVVSVLGRGGMGTVYEVVRLIDQKTFALKVLSGRGGSVEMARFAREAQLVAQLQHPNVVSIVDVDVATNGLLFIVLELVRGKTLREHMTRAVGDREFALGLLRQIAEGLSAIHAGGIIHRDLKPDNILVLEDGAAGAVQVKITDFGVSAVAGAALEADHVRASRAPQAGTGDLTVPLAIGGATPSEVGPAPKPHDPDHPRLTEEGMLIGTPRYMAPEAIEGTSPAVDLFAFGVMAFELLAASTPFLEPPVMQRLAGRPMLPAPSLLIVVDDLDETLAALIDRCLSEDPARRPSAAELAQGLQALGGPARANMRGRRPLAASR